MFLHFYILSIPHILRSDGESSQSLIKLISKWQPSLVVVEPAEAGLFELRQKNNASMSKERRQRHITMGEERGATQNGRGRREDVE